MNQVYFFYVTSISFEADFIASILHGRMVHVCRSGISSSSMSNRDNEPRLFCLSRLLKISFNNKNNTYSNQVVRSSIEKKISFLKAVSNQNYLYKQYISLKAWGLNPEYII